jgi:hypothetical protein
MTGLAPTGDGFCYEPRFRIMLSEELWLVLHHLGRMCFERLRDLSVLLLPGAAQEAVVRRVLH